jgi:hypothetical protein
MIKYLVTTTNVRHGKIAGVHVTSTTVNQAVFSMQETAKEWAGAQVCSSTPSITKIEIPADTTPLPPPKEMLGIIGRGW